MSNKSSNNNSVNSSRVNSGSGHSGSRGNSSRGHSRNNSGNNLGNLIKQSKVNVANTNLTSPNTPGTADNSEKEKDKKTASNYDPSDAITSLINNMDHLNIEKAIPDNSLMVTSTMIEELFNMFTNDVMKLLVHENTHKDDIFGNTEIPLALDDYGDPIPVIVEKTPEQLENEKMLADKLNILKQKVNEKVIRCMDEHLTQSRNSLLFHRKKIQDKLFLTRESLVLSKDVTDRAQSHLHNESLRIVRATLQDRFNAELDVKNAEIKELTYNNRILNQKITECMEENMKHVGSIAELQLKLAPFIKGHKKKNRKMSTLNDPHSMGPNVGQNRSRPGSNMSPNRFTRNMNSGPSSIIHEGDEFGDYRESHPGMLSTGNGSGSGVTVDSWSHSRSETPTNFQSTPTNPKQSRAFSPSPNETKPAVCNRCTIYKEEIAQLQMSLNDTLAALNIDATRSALNTATPGPRASSPGVILTPPPTHSILPLKPKEPKASDLLSDENSMSFVELEKEIQHEKVVESSDNKASSTEAKTMPSSDRGDNIAENLANTDNTGSLVLASEDKNSIKGVAGTVQASNEQEFLGSDTTLAFAKVSVTAEGSLHTENEEKTVAAVEASQKPIQKDDLESKAVKESDISENPLTVDTKKYVSIEVESKVPQDTVSKQEISSKDATAAVDGNPGPVLESLTENRISPQRVVSPTNIDRVSAATATMHLQKERSPSHSPAIQVHSDKAAESSTTTPSSLPNSRDGKCSVSPPAAHSAVSQFIAQQRSESLKYQQMHQATLSRGTAAGTEPATVPAADQSTSSVKEQSPSTATVNEAVPSLSLGSSQGTTLNQVDFKGFSDDSPGNSRGCSRQQLELEAKKNESKQCIAIPVSSNSGALNEVYQSNTKIFTSINSSNSNAGSVQSEHSIMVPSQAQSSVHSSNNPLMLVDSSAIAMLSKQKEENTMLIKLLHESSSVQAELQNVVASLQKQNTDLLAKIKEDEDVMATNSNLYRLQLKERGLLLRELSNEVNNLRSEIARTKSINNRSRITVPLKSSISDIKNQASSNIMTKQSIELNSADMLYSDPSVNETKQPPSVIPHHDALVAKHKQALDQIPGRPFSQGNELIWTPDAGAVPIATSASCSQLNPSKVLQNKTGKTLFEASGGAFGRIDLRKQQEELEFQESLLRMPWHDRMNAIKERQAREEELEVKKLYSTRAKSPPTKNKKINRNRKSTENLDNSEAEADGNISNSDANRLYNSSAGLDATYGGNSELVQNCSALILPELPEAKRIELKAIRDQIAIIMAEKIGPKKQKLLAVHEAAEKKLRNRKLFAVKAVKARYGSDEPI